MTKLFFELPKNRELDFRFELPLVTLEVLISMCATSPIWREGFFDRKSIIKQFARKSLHLVATIKETNKHREVKWLKLKKTRNNASVSLNLCFLANSVGCSLLLVFINDCRCDTFFWLVNCSSMKIVHGSFYVTEIGGILKNIGVYMNKSYSEWLPKEMVRKMWR